MAHRCFWRTTGGSCCLCASRVRSSALSTCVPEASVHGSLSTLSVCNGWGTWWEWDARLTTTAILFFLYLGYLALRRTAATADERGKRSAIAALIAFVDVPVSYLSVTWWQTLHQQGTVFNERLSVQIDGSMALTLVAAVVSFTLLYGYLVLERFELAQLEEGREARELERAIAERVRAEHVEALPA